MTRREYRRLIHPHYDDRSEARAIAGMMRGVTEQTRALELRTRRDVQAGKTDGWHILITRCTYPQRPGTLEGFWRATKFDNRGPFTHFHGRTIRDIIGSLCGERVPGIGLPHGYGEWVVISILKFSTEK